MNILFLSNNSNTKILYDWLRNTMKENVIYFDEKLTDEDIRKYRPDFIISYNYKFIINKEVIDSMRGRIINLHISLLPWNKGAHPNVWSFIDDTPKGVTIHWIDEGIDTGGILVDKEVFFDENIETLQTSYEKLHNEIQELFRLYWNDIKQGKIKAKEQKSNGTFHYKKEFENLKKNIELDYWNITIKELKKILKTNKQRSS